MVLTTPAPPPPPASPVPGPAVLPPPAAALVQQQRTAPDMSEEVKREANENIQIHDAFQAQEQESKEREAKVKGDKSLKAAAFLQRTAPDMSEEVTREANEKIQIHDASFQAQQEQESKEMEVKVKGVRERACSLVRRVVSQRSVRHGAEGPVSYVHDQCYFAKNIGDHTEYAGSDPMSPQVCYGYCSSLAPAPFYFGLEDGSKCWCGTGLGASMVAGPCDKPCPGDAEAKCGGDALASVYIMVPVDCGDGGTTAGGGSDGTGEPDSKSLGKALDKLADAAAAEEQAQQGR